MPSLLIRNIKTLYLTESAPLPVRAGADMACPETISDAYIVMEHDRIVAFGPMQECPERADVQIDATGRLCLPAWCDSHTHIVFAASREEEFVDRIRGLSYEEIAARGGGILNSARRMQDATEDQLFESAYGRLQEVMRHGTGALEIKSGYGLTVESELKMLRVVKRLREVSPIPIKATFLGAHAVPLLYKERRAEYIRLVTDVMMPQVVEEGLAEYCDVFCDKGFYTVEETDTILKAAAQYGLKAKIHANELDYSGGVQIGVANNAVSVDHLEYCGDEEIACLRNSNTLPTVLPSCAFFLGIPYAPARKMIDAGLPVVLATDYNPGSSPSGRMPFVIALACIKMKLLPEEAITAATINGAWAMELAQEVGSIAVGKKANLILTKPAPSLAYLPYAFGENWVEKVILNGREFI